MKVSQLISELEMYMRLFGDDEVEFTVTLEGEDEPVECSLREVHDGYSADARECEVRLDEISAQP